MYDKLYWVEVLYNNGETIKKEYLTYGQLHTELTRFSKNDEIVSMRNGYHERDIKSR